MGRAAARKWVKRMTRWQTTPALRERYARLFYHRRRWRHLWGVA